MSAPVVKRIPQVAAARSRVARMLRKLRLEDPALAREVSLRIRAARLQVVGTPQRDVALACRAVSGRNP